MIPKSVKIGGREFKVKIVHSEEELDNKYNGAYCSNKNEIVLDDRPPQSLMEQNLIHEILHGCWDMGATENLDLDKWEEYIVDMFANNIYAVIKDNKGIFNF